MPPSLKGSCPHPLKGSIAAFTIKEIFTWLLVKPIALNHKHTKERETRSSIELPDVKECDASAALRINLQEQQIELLKLATKPLIQDLHLFPTLKWHFEEQ